MFIYEKAPFPSCHASSIVELSPNNYMATWFGGKDEGAKDVQIWASVFDGKAWSKLEILGTEPGYPTYNPVLFWVTKEKLALWYKAGNKPDIWTGYVRWSSDQGKSWTKPEMMPASFFGPVRAKPIKLADGSILAGTSVESHKNWTPFVDRSTDQGKTWLRSNAYNVPGQYGQIQPTLFETKDGHIVALMRSRSPKQICRSVSTDGGKTFTPAEPLERMPNPSAGIDAVRLKSGDVYLIHNPTTIGRSPITVSKSSDDGKKFTKLVDLETEPGEYSYPAMIATHDEKLAITYTWRRTHIKFVVLDPATGKLVIS